MTKKTDDQVVLSVPPYNATAFADRKTTLVDRVKLQGIVEADGDYYVIDPDPPWASAEIRARKEDVILVPAGEHAGIDGGQSKVFTALIRKDARLLRQTFDTIVASTLEVRVPCPKSMLKGKSKGHPCGVPSAFTLDGNNPNPDGRRMTYGCPGLRKITIALGSGQVHVQSGRFETSMLIPQEMVGLILPPMAIM